MLLLGCCFDEGKTPCHSTFAESFRAIDIEDLEKILSKEIILYDQILPADLPVAIDGKRLRGSRHEEHEGVHLLSIVLPKIARSFIKLPC